MPKTSSTSLEARHVGHEVQKRRHDRKRRHRIGRAQLGNTVRSGLVRTPRAGILVFFLRLCVRRPGLVPGRSFSDFLSRIRTSLFGLLPSGEASPVSEAEARPFTTLSSASSDSESGADAGAATGAAVDAARAAAGASAAMAGRASEAMARAMSFLFCMSRPVWAAGSWAGGASSITSSILAGF